MSPPSSDATPNDPAADATSGSAAGSTANGSFDWTSLLSLVHPDKIAVIEALLFIGRPLSATDLSKCFGAAGRGLSHVSYHVTSLAEAGLLEKVSERQVRGANEKFYFFP